MAQQSSRLVVVSARAPFVAEGPKLSRAPGGLVSALLPAVRRLEGTWIAAGTEHDAVGTIDSQFRVIPVSIPKDTRSAWYVEASSEALWPLAHGFIERCRFKDLAARAYQDVNQRVADVVASVAPLRATVWIHDYQLAFVPAYVRASRPDLTIGFFWHVPWPMVEFFRTLPWRRELVEGILGADVVGVHVPRYVAAFGHALRELGIAYEVDQDKLVVPWKSRASRIIACPVGADASSWSALGRDADVQANAAQLRDRLGGSRLLLSVDRLDYTKGIVGRLQAYERLLERSVEAREQVTFVQIAVPSRESVGAYRALREDVEGLVGRINGRFGSPRRTPLHLFERSFDARELAAFYLAADAAIVTPLRDGMNLVAFEYPATRPASTGRLVLSELTGAADVLRGSILVNPYDEAGFDEVLARVALSVETNDDAVRMTQLRDQVAKASVDHWTSNFLAQLERPRPSMFDDARRRDGLRRPSVVQAEEPRVENGAATEIRRRRA